jgi:cell division septum initiation protein DivIVA
MTLAHSEMPTPERVRSAAFSPTRLGRRGVDESEVRAFCEWIADGLGLLLNDNNMLQAEIMRLRDRLLDGRGRTGIQPEDAHLQAVQVLSQAQQTADRYVADAQEYSRERLPHPPPCLPRIPHPLHRRVGTRRAQRHPHRAAPAAAPGQHYENPASRPTEHL